MKTKSNTSTQILKAGNHVRSLGVFRARDMVADCFKYRQRHGLDVAIEALRDGWRQKKFTMNELSKAAAVCRVSRVIQPYVEMLA